MLELEVGPLAVGGGTPRTHWKLECSYFPPTRGCGPRPAPSELLIRVIDLFHGQVKARKRGNLLGRAIP